MLPLCGTVVVSSIVCEKLFSVEAPGTLRCRSARRDASSSPISVGTLYVRSTKTACAGESLVSLLVDSAGRGRVVLGDRRVVWISIRGSQCAGFAKRVESTVYRDAMGQVPERDRPYSSESPTLCIHLCERSAASGSTHSCGRPRRCARRAATKAAARSSQSTAAHA